MRNLESEEHRETRGFGIDKLNFYTPNQYVDLVELARARCVDPDKYLIGIGQERMAVAPVDQDIVSMGANAAEPLLDDVTRASLGLLVLGTESGIDQSKAAALFVHQLLALPEGMRVMEIKEACYGATAGLMVALDFVRSHPDRRALVIASDIARYGLDTPGEVTQGAGAVAMIVSADPTVLAIEPGTVVASRSTYDFWRPNYSTVAFAQGKYSEEVYLAMFRDAWNRASQMGLTCPEGLAAQLFHIPFSKMGRKGLRTLQGMMTDDDYGRLANRFEDSIRYGRQVGNIYTGSLYLGLISLLENDSSLRPGDRMGLFSYGSGSESELFFGKLCSGFQSELNSAGHRAMLEGRTKLCVEEYERVFNAGLVQDGSRQVLERSDFDAPHYLTGLDRHQRLYR